MAAAAVILSTMMMAMILMMVMVMLMFMMCYTNDLLYFPLCSVPFLDALTPGASHSPTSPRLDASAHPEKPLDLCQSTMGT